MTEKTLKDETVVPWSQVRSDIRRARGQQASVLPRLFADLTAPRSRK